MIHSFALIGAVVLAAPPKKNPMTTLTDASVSSAERVAAAKALATSKDPLAVDTLIRALGSMDEALTSAVVASLRAQNAVPALAKRLTDANVVEPRKVQACVGLRHLKDPAAVPSLASALEDPSASVRKEAALALLVIGPAGAEDALITALRDSDGDVRYGAAEALGKIPGDKVTQALNAALAKETNPTVRFALEGSLERRK